MMKVTLAKNAGFCQGVKRAFKIVEQLAKKGQKPIFILGPLVHNEEVIKHFEKQGIKKINNLRGVKKGTVVISAHGLPPLEQAKIKKKGLNICDATCPKVLRTHILAKEAKKQNVPLIIIGDQGHREVEGILGWAGQETVVISEVEEIEKINFGQKEAVNLICQTTQDTEKVQKISVAAKKKWPRLKLYNTVCLATFKRQAEIRQLAKNNQAILVIGSRTSANTNRLFKIAQEINPKTYLISRKSEIKKDWFSGVKKTAVTAGASTPNWIIKSVIDKLENGVRKRGQ